MPAVYITTASHPEITRFYLNFKTTQRAFDTPQFHRLIVLVQSARQPSIYERELENPAGHQKSMISHHGQTLLTIHNGPHQ